MVHRITNLQILDDWLAGLPPGAPERLPVLLWIMDLMDEQAPPGVTTVPVLLGLPVHVAIVPDTNVGVGYCVLDSPPYAEPMVALAYLRSRS